MYETEITIPANDIQLSGTLCLPEKDGIFPVVLLIHGSGKLDRNENANRFDLDVFNSIAHYLAENGIATYRYDKRGIGKSTGDYYSAGHFDLIDDAMCCLEFLSTHPQCQKDALFLLGHSEGSIIVPQMAQRNIPVAGLILLTPFIEQMESLLMQQAADIKKAVNNLTGIKNLVTKWMLKLFDPVKFQARFIKKVKQSKSDTIRTALKKMPAKWFRELFTLDPLSIYQNTKTPSLIIGGSKDVQCNPKDVAAIEQSIQAPVEAHLIKDLSHLLRFELGKPSVFSYPALLKKPIEPQVLEIIGEWLKKEVKSK